MSCKELVSDSELEYEEEESYDSSSDSDSYCEELDPDSLSNANTEQVIPVENKTSDESTDALLNSTLDIFVRMEELKDMLSANIELITTAANEKCDQSTNVTVDDLKSMPELNDMLLANIEQATSAENDKRNECTVETVVEPNTSSSFAHTERVVRKTSDFCKCMAELKNILSVNIAQDVMGENYKRDDSTNVTVDDLKSLPEQNDVLHANIEQATTAENEKRNEFTTETVVEPNTTSSANTEQGIAAANVLKKKDVKRKTLLSRFCAAFNFVCFIVIPIGIAITLTMVTLHHRNLYNHFIDMKLDINAEKFNLDLFEQFFFQNVVQLKTLALKYDLPVLHQQCETMIFDFEKILKIELSTLSSSMYPQQFMLAIRGNN